MAGSRQRFHVLLIAVAMALLGCGTTQVTQVQKAKPLAAAAPLQWESGSFAQLPLRGSGDLVTYVDSLAHDPSYTALTATRESQVGAMFDAIQTAITAMIGGDLNADWCTPVTAAGTAGYRLGRYYDTVSQRWLIVGADNSGTGQAYFFINPEPRRDLIIEAPHVYASNSKLEGRTDTEGAILLRQTLGRALLINGTDRCQGGVNGCGGTFSSNTVCDGFGNGDQYRQSDAGHNADIAFQVLHEKLNDVSTSTRFVQLHGNADSGLAAGGISVSDGRSSWPTGTSGLATTFVNAIQTLSTGALAASSVNDCTSESNILCGYRNVQGRYTNSPTATCNSGTMTVGGTRFLHLEQRTGSGSIQSLIDAPQPVSDALQATFPCAGCALPAQVVPNPPNACPEL